MPSLYGVHSATILTPPSPESNPKPKLLFARRIGDDNEEFLSLTKVCSTQGTMSLQIDSEGAVQAKIAWNEADGTRRERSTTANPEDNCEGIDVGSGQGIMYAANATTVHPENHGGELLQMGYSSEDIRHRIDDGWEVAFAEALALSNIRTDSRTPLMPVDSNHYKAVKGVLQQESLEPSCFRAKVNPDGRRRPLVFAKSSRNDNIYQITENIDNLPATLKVTGEGSGTVSWTNRDGMELGTGEESQERSTTAHPKEDKMWTIRLPVVDTPTNRLRRRISLSSEHVVSGKGLRTKHGTGVTEEVDFYASNCYEVDTNNDEAMARLGLSERELEDARKQLALGDTLYAAGALVAGGNLGSTFNDFIDKDSQH